MEFDGKRSPDSVEGSDIPFVDSKEIELLPSIFDGAQSVTKIFAEAEEAVIERDDESFVKSLVFFVVEGPTVNLVLT